MIEVNGKQVEWVENETISQLLKRMRYVFPLVVVKVDSILVTRDSYNDFIVPDDSKISVIHMISGG